MSKVYYTCGGYYIPINVGQNSSMHVDSKTSTNLKLPNISILGVAVTLAFDLQNLIIFQNVTVYLFK